ncbi:hypothetical protein LTR48_002195, partial [Friedmanniomyces endolithicus]
MAASEDSPVAMSGKLDGPPGPHDYYDYNTHHRSSSPTSNHSVTAVSQMHASAGSAHVPLANRAFTRSPVGRQLRAVTDPVGGADHALNSVRSNPVLLPSRQPGSVKNIANKFDQGAAAAGGPPVLRVQTTQERYKRAPPGKSEAQKSPVGASGSRSESGMVKLQKRRPVQPRSPQKSPETSFETSSSFASNATITSAKSQPQPATTRRDAKTPMKTVPYASAKPPLFGELTADGWHGNFELSSYGPLGTLQLMPRRQSAGNVALGHGRSQSQQDVSRTKLSPPSKQKLHHKRSRSEMDAFLPPPGLGLPSLHGQNVPALYPTPPNSGTRNPLRKDSPTSRIPISSRRLSQDSSIGSDPYSRSASAMSNGRGEVEENAGESPIMLSAVSYQPPSALPTTPPFEPIPRHEPEKVQSPSVLDNVRRMRERSQSSASGHDTTFAGDSPLVEDSPSDIEDRWGLEHGLGGDQGSIKIMLDEDPTLTQGAGPWPKHEESKYREAAQEYPDPEAAKSLEPIRDSIAQHDYTESPVDGETTLPDGMIDLTPRRQPRDDTLKPSTYKTAMAFTATSDTLESDTALARGLDQYQTTGEVAPEMLLYIQNHSVDLQRLSANGGSDALMVQNLLDSMLDARPATKASSARDEDMLQPTQYGLPPVTPDTPPGAATVTGTAVVFATDAAGDTIPENDEEADFHEKIRKADEEWERQQRDEEATLGAIEEEAPLPPPKDFGYTPRSSTGPNSAVFPPGTFAEGLLLPIAGDTSSESLATGGSVASTPSAQEHLSPPRSAPPLPLHAPPPPPAGLVSPTTITRLPFGMSEVPQLPVPAAERESSELSPRVRKNLWGPSGSSRPSVDSQRAAPPSLPGAASMSSFADSTRASSMERGPDSQTQLGKPTSPTPEYKRLMKRKHIIKELLDTENSYHQDLKIIEDIYKATVGDLVTTEDTRTLFGNCDEIERFSLFFYDELRKAVAPVYVPAKQMRWANKRGSYSTTQSDGTGQTSMASADSIDEERDRGTTIGQCFLTNLHRMDQVYGAYLKNHDAANQRLTALKNTPTVKCWLDECHNNASDITSAWDLDSLLVKPTQRVAKYPLMLQQLFESTPRTHPDYEALKSAAKDSVGMLTRINEAKKRADLVDQIINRKGKDTDVRSGIAKAFGRRTEKLKERVGIAEAFQDAEFDELSHKFGGHFIRLQICMRDVQDYLHRIDKAMDQITNTAAALDLYTDVAPSSLPEIESKWRRYGQAIREIAAIALPEHKAAVHKRVIQPMITCIKLHEGPQNAINKRKRRIVDYAKCKSIEKRGEKPDRKVVEASEMYEALNDQLKIELPKLYGLTASLVQGCLTCFLEIQLKWYNLWERKLG